MEDLTGRQFGPYRIVGPLGEGGMAAVYRAYQANVDRYVALKVLPRYFASDPTFVGRFEQEAKVVAKLQHPHVLPVYDFGEADGYTYIVMPFVEGGTLGVLMKQMRLPWTQVQNIVAQVGDALDYAHSLGVVHRDVKPSNILVDQRGNCLLSDFGIAKMVEGTTAFTRSGGSIGTPAYMSPEQIRGEKLDGRSDIYSLGIVLYEMSTGRLPFRADTPPAVFVKHLHDPLPPPHIHRPDIPQGVERVILKSLAKEREARYNSGNEMAMALARGVASRPLAGPTAEQVQRPTPPRQTARPAPKRFSLPLLALVVALICVIAVGGTFIALGGLSGADQEGPAITQLTSTATRTAGLDIGTTARTSPSTATDTVSAQAPTSTPLSPARTPPSTLTPAPTSTTAQQMPPPPQFTTVSVIDDIEAGDYWESFGDDMGSTVQSGLDAGTVHGGSASLRIEYDVVDGGWGDCGRSFEPSQDWSNGDGISLWLHSDTVGQSVMLVLTAGDVGAPTPFTLYFQTTAESASGWVQYVFSWADFAVADWAATDGLSELDATQTHGLGFSFGPGQGVLWVDDILLAAGEK